MSKLSEKLLPVFQVKTSEFTSNFFNDGLVQKLSVVWLDYLATECTMVDPDSCYHQKQIK